MVKESNPFLKLERTIAARAKRPNPKSYTSKLLEGGVEKIGAKIVEEAAEVVEAAGEAGQEGVEHFVREMGDLVYHMIVMLQHKECQLADVETELARRFGVSGLEEKASRKPKSNTNSEGAVEASNSTKTTKKKPVAKTTNKSSKAGGKVSVPAVKKKTKRKSRL